MTKLAEQIRKEIIDSGVTDDIAAGLYDAVEKMSEDEIRKYIYVNKSYFNKMIPTVIESSPSLNKLIAIQPNWSGKVTDFDKMFNTKDFLDKYYTTNEWTKSDVDLVAEINGMTGDDLRKKIQEAKIAKDRENIAHGGTVADIFNKDKWTETPWNGLIENPIVQNPIFKNIGGLAMNLLAPRVQESIERAEDPSAKDYAGDAAQLVAYSLPVGFGTGLASKGLVKVGSKVAPNATKKVSSMLGGKVGNLSKIGVSNAAVPAAVEGVDAAMYDADNNPRGEYSLYDVGAGTITNIMTPMLLRGLVSRGGNIIEDKGARSMWDNWGSNESTRDLGEYLIERNELAKGVTRNPEHYGYLERKSAEPDIALREYVKQGGELSKKLSGLSDEAITRNIKVNLGRLTVTPGRNFNEKLRNSGLSEMIDDPDYIEILKDSYLNLPAEVQIRSEAALPVSTLIGQEGAKNLITNKTGDYLYENGMILSRVPVVGPALKKSKEEQESLDENAKARKEAEERYRINWFGL